MVMQVVSTLGVDNPRLRIGNNRHGFMHIMGYARAGHKVSNATQVVAGEGR